MAPKIHDNIVDAADEPIIGATVEIALVIGADQIGNGFVTTLTESISAPVFVSTDANGYWSATVISNSLITPANTAYRIRYRRPGKTAWDQTLYVSAPNDSSDHWVYNILTGAPGGPGPSQDLSAYQLRSEKESANGYAGLDANARLALARMGSGTPDTTKFLRGDGSWQVPPGTSSPSPVQYEQLDKRNASGAISLDVSSYNVFDLTLTGNVTSLTIINEDGTHAWSLTLILRQDGTGGRTVAWGSTYKWPNGLAPQVSTAANKVDVFTMITTDGGTTWYAFQAGQAMA